MSDLESTLPEPEMLMKVHRLVHELCELGNDARAWRERMLEEVCQWLNVSMAAAYVVKISLDPSDFESGTLIYVGRGENEAWRRFVADGDVGRDPVNAKIMERFGTDFTCARQELLDDATWYASDHFKTMYKPNQWDQVLYSQVAIHSGLVDGIGLVRALGKPAYSQREVTIVRTIHQELARLWRRPEPLAEYSLPPRQRQVLKGIRDGETRKQIAEKMGVSDHTVHDYEKALFEKTGVTSRGTLLARLAKQVRPVLLPIILAAVGVAMSVRIEGRGRQEVEPQINADERGLN